MASRNRLLHVRRKRRAMRLLVYVSWVLRSQQIHRMTTRSTTTRVPALQLGRRRPKSIARIAMTALRHVRRTALITRSPTARTLSRLLLTATKVSGNKFRVFRRAKPICRADLLLLLNHTSKVSPQEECHGVVRVLVPAVMPRIGLILSNRPMISLVISTGR